MLRRHESQRRADEDAFERGETGLIRERLPYLAGQEAERAQDPDFVPTLPHRSHHDDTEPGDPDEEPQGEIPLHQSHELQLCALELLDDGSKRIGPETVLDELALHARGDITRRVMSSDPETGCLDASGKSFVDRLARHEHWE